VGGIPINQVYFPFIPQNPLGSQGVFPYDVVIREAFPGLIFDPAEVNGVYVEFREVSGTFWFVTNATFNINTQTWQQNGDSNPANPAYALTLTGDGKMIRYYAAPTTAPNVNVNWLQAFEVSKNGNILTTPATMTPGNNEAALALSPTWTLTTSVGEVFTINLTDNSSSASSNLELFKVNGTTVWQLDKTGTLLAGIIPWARITGAPAAPVTSVSGSGPGITVSPTTGAVVVSLSHGDYVDLGNAQTITGAKEFSALIDADAGIDVEGALGTFHNGISVTGGLTTDSEHVTGDLQVDGATTVNGLTTAGGLVLTGATPVVSFVGFSQFESGPWNLSTTPTFSLGFPFLHKNSGTETWAYTFMLIATNTSGTVAVTVTPIGTGIAGPPQTQSIVSGAVNVLQFAFGSDGTTGGGGVNMTFTGTATGIVAAMASVVRVT
jgi:hypothetical protein